MELEKNTEEKIKEAARKIFQQKGFAGARTRDIAQEAGINLALLNYYFRSKEKLFAIIMIESLQSFVQNIKGIINNPETTCEQKIQILVERYITMLNQQPDLPIFILNEIRVNPEKLLESFDLPMVFKSSIMFVQFEQEVQAKRYKNINPIHIILNVVGMTVFPFIAKPLISIVGNISDSEYIEFMNQRKTLIPQWILSQIQIK